jgi:hypothetical protein
MATCINVYSEIRKNGEWTAIEKDTFVEEAPNRFGWVNASMRRVPCPEKYIFYGLLLSGARASYPWSFHQRGMPEDTSDEVRSVCDSFGVEAYGHSHLTLKELVEKYLELMIAGPEAKELMVYLRELIDCLTGFSEDHRDVRIVFWFDN